MTNTMTNISYVHHDNQIQVDEPFLSHLYVSLSKQCHPYKFYKYVDFYTKNALSFWLQTVGFAK